MRAEHWLYTIPLRLRSLFRRRRADLDLDEELHDHVALKTKDYIAKGMAPQEARRAALIELGGFEQTKEECRDMRKINWLQDFIQDVRYGLRMMRKSPGFTAVAILTLALGIGANSAVFSAIDAVLLRPLPFPDGDQLMRISQYNPKVRGGSNPFVAPVRLEDWNRMNSAFQALTGYYTEDDSETSGPIPEKITIGFVAARFLQVWGVAPEFGHDFTPEGEHSTGFSEALISNRYWRQRFGGNPDVLGKNLRIFKSSITVIGVMPASFIYPDPDVDVWLYVPIGGPYTLSRDDTWYTVIGRLKKGVTLEQARANLATVQAQLGKQFPKPDADISVKIQPLKNTIVGQVGRSFWMLFGAVSLLLLIACTNIAALLLARSSHRRHEISIRFALGATRAAILRQLLTETFLLALAGAALGLLIADAASSVFQTLAASLPRVSEIRLDPAIVLYTLGSSVIVTLLCGLVPALRTAREGISGSLAQTAAMQVSSRNHLQWLLVSVQVALAVTLLAGAGLLVRSFEEIARVSAGFEPAHILTFHISASYAETVNYKALTARVDGDLDSLRALPGVTEAATSATLPGVPSGPETELKIVGGQASPDRKIMADTFAVSPDYFAAMQIPLLEGATCRELPNGVEVMVNRSFANTYLPNLPVIGRHIASGGFLGTGQISGIVGDAREEGLNHAPQPTVYWCFSAPMPDPNFLVRTSAGPMSMAETVRKALAKLEPGRSVFDISPLTDHLSESFSENRLRMILLGFFALTAIALASIGLYGTLSYSVAVRKREIGLRMAIGATRGQIATMFLYKGLGVCAVGCALGLALAVVFARVLAGMLYGVSPNDLLTLSAVVVLVAVVASVASLLPAIRAARVDPMVALRYE
jgi:putative ABC transport system permease protein